MSSKRHHPHKGGTTPTTEPKDRSGVVQFSVSEEVQFSMSLDMLCQAATPYAAPSAPAGGYMGRKLTSLQTGVLPALGSC